MKKKLFLASTLALSLFADRQIPRPLGYPSHGLPVQWRISVLGDWKPRKAKPIPFNMGHLSTIATAMDIDLTLLAPNQPNQQPGSDFP